MSSNSKKPIHSSNTQSDFHYIADALPSSFVYRYFPKTVWPYAQLARWDRPIGWWLLLWPCWWSVALVGQWTQSLNFLHMLLFMVGAIAMRGAGCTYNDIVDRDLDRGVARTRSRPLPSGLLSLKQAWAFLVLQALIGLLVLVQFNSFAIIVGLFSLIVVAVYPFIKRISYWPQFILGLAFSWGSLMGFAGGMGFLPPPAFALYLGCVAWTIGYDTIYAQQDLEDDMLMGIRSTALLFGGKAYLWIFGFYLAGLLFFTLAAFLSGTSWPAYLGLTIAAIQMGWQIHHLDIDNPAQCLRLFKSNAITGWIVFIGFSAAIWI